MTVITIICLRLFSKMEIASRWIQKWPKITNSFVVCHSQFVMYSIYRTSKIGNNNILIPAFAHGPHSPVLEERMPAAMGATGECSAGPHIQCSMCIDSDIFRPMASSVIITFTYHFTIDDYCLQNSKYWVQWYALYRLDMTSKFNKFCPKNWPWNHMELLPYKTAIPGLCSWYILYHLKNNFFVDCENIIQSTIKAIHYINSSPPGQNGRHFTDDIFGCIFVNEKFCISIKFSLKFVPKGPVDNNPALV